MNLIFKQMQNKINIYTILKWNQDVYNILNFILIYIKFMLIKIKINIFYYVWINVKIIYKYYRLFTQIFQILINVFHKRIHFSHINWISKKIWIFIMNINKK